MLLLGVLLPACCLASRCAPVEAAHGTVATVHPLGTDAGVRALKRGGNAVDAAVAAALTLGVVDGRNAGIGGGCFILIRRADGKVVAIDGRETAPAAATRDMYLRDGKPQPELSLTGPLASGVPGALAAYDHALRHHGRLELRDLLLPAAEIAEEGFAIQPAYASALEQTADKLARFEGSRGVLLKPDGSPYAAGERLKQPDLARTYRAVAERGIDWFYRGPFARHVGKWMSRNGGILTADDLAAYRVRRREPVRTRYRQYTIVGFPPPSSGGVHVAQILNVLEQFDLRSLHQRDPALFYHVVAEAMKLAFADRAHWLGDPDFADVPRGLVDKEYAKELAARIRLDAVTAVLTHGGPPRWRHDHFGKHTTHVAAADGEGNWVAITATVNMGFGSKVIVPDTGVILNNQMDDFSVAPGVPNAFGLLGAEANAIAAGKRPLSSMSPTIVLRDGRPVLTLGAAGGPKIISQVLITVLYHLDLGMELPEALAAPRIHHQWRPDELLVEQSLDAAIVAALEKLGHRVERARSIGVTQAIGVTRSIGVSPDGPALVGVHDPRVRGRAAAFSPRDDPSAKPDSGDSGAE
jgi:gamma-glutamyltranspeptidase/glutathione hydrolase